MPNEPTWEETSPVSVAEPEAPKWDDTKPVESTPSQDRPDFISRLFSALGRAPAAQREEAQIQTEFAAKDNPLVNVSPELVKNLSGNLTALSMISPEAGKGVSEEVASAATALTKPSNLAIAGAAAIAPVPVGLALGALGAKSAGESAGEASVAIDQGNTEEAARLLTRTGLSVAQAAIAPVAGLKGFRGTESILPASTKAVEQLDKGVKPEVTIPETPFAEPKAEEAAPPIITLNTNPRPIPGTDVAAPVPISEPIKASVSMAASPLESLSDSVRSIWRSAANEAMPKITESSRELGEAGVRAVTSRMVGRDMGEIFADKVLRELEVDPKEFGAFAAEDNLRWREEDFRTKAKEASEKGDVEDAQTLNEAADAVGTIVGAKGSPFQTHEDFLKYWERPEVKEAAARHIEMWKEQKDPLFRQANDLDPETPLASRGLVSGMRVNMKGIPEGEKSPTALPVRDSAAGLERIGEGEEPIRSGGRSTLIRQMATLKKSDPFNRTFSGLSPAYETDYYELMRNGFGREMPVAAQHEFIRKMISSGDAAVSDKAFEPELTLKGEPTVGRLLKLNPWAGGPAKFLQVRKSLASEYDNATGLTPSMALPGLKQIANVFTRASVAGLAEGTTHMGNLLSQVITGPGPTSNPLINGLVKSLGRVDLLYSIPRVFVRAMKATKEEVAGLMAEGAAKEPYTKVDPSAPSWKQFLQKNSLGHLLLDPTDKGVRLTSQSLYDNFVKSGWITDASETGRREFVNQVGNYNRALQPVWMRALRDNVQPFITAVHTFNVQGLRRMAGSAGIRDLTPAQRVAFAADVYGGWVGFITAAVGLNWMLNKDAPTTKERVFGPTGTKLGEVGWLDSEGKLRTVNLARIAGYERGLQRTGILPAVEALRRGLGGNAAVDAAGNAIAQTGVNYLTGPVVRSGFLGATGKTPSVPSFQEAPIVAPQDEFNPLKTQLASNIGTALKEANPLIDSAISLAKGIHEGHTAEQLIDEAGKKQLSRYYPGQKSSVQQSEDFAEIVKKARINDFVDDIARRARKLPEDQRHKFIEDNTPDDIRVTVNKKLKQKGVFKPDK